MKVSIHDYYTNCDIVFSGSTQVVFEKLLNRYPWFRDCHDLNELLDAIDGQQGTSVDVVNEGPEALHKTETSNLVSESIEPDSQVVRDLLGFNHESLRTFEAARFLASCSEIPFDRARTALWQADGELEHAALHAVGLEATPANLSALRSVRDLGFNKSEPEAPPTASSIVAAVPEAEYAAQAVRRAFSDQFVFRAKLAGKHSSGSLLARDTETHKVYLLKPNAHGQSPAAGAAEDPSSPAAREAAFYQVAEHVGLGEYYPTASLIYVDEKPYAALSMLPFDYQTLERRRKEEPGLPQSILRRYLADGTIHRWAALDFVLGNPDRHANNIMVNEAGDVSLIDHGSAFAGDQFDPANDKDSFVPYYLRAWAKGNFHALSSRERFQLLPRLSVHSAAELHTWLSQIDPANIASILHRYGIDPSPELMRLARLKGMAEQLPADEAIDRLWAGF